MEDIRFRVFYNGKMYYPEGEGNAESGWHIHQGGKLGFNIYDYPGAAYMLSTKRKDTDDRELYVDDIVQHTYPDGEIVICLIYWVDGMGFGMEELNGWDEMTKYGPMREGTMKYLGNVHQEPTLLIISNKT